MEHLIAHLIGPFVGRLFFRTVRCCPVVFAAAALAGDGVGLWLVLFAPAGEWVLIGLGISMLFFYTSLLILLTVKLRVGTWGAFCDWGESIFKHDGGAKPGGESTLHTITYYPKSKLSLDDLKEFVRSFPEAEWITETGAGRGLIECEDARIYLDYDDHYREYFQEYLDEQQQAELTARLGFAPILAVHVQASHAYQHSRELAEAVCEDLAKKWGGCWVE